MPATTEPTYAGDHRADGDPYDSRPEGVYATFKA
jgi:hypothetical protein